VLQLTRSVARQYAAEGIRANCVCTGAVRTDIVSNSTR
jgi:NAD(P)-dependent dehydrogenase (short-subunit alcohol dehydrogenase family)